MSNTPEEFWAKVNIQGPDECWPWLGSIDKKSGYGHVYFKGAVRPAHRVALAIHLGKDIERGFDSCHSCHNRPCCNPNHLIEDTHLNNVKLRNKLGRSRGGSSKGEAHGRAKLTERDVREIRRLDAEGKHSKCKLGSIYGVSDTMIGKIVRGEAWGHIK